MAEKMNLDGVLFWTLLAFGFIAFFIEAPFYTSHPAWWSQAPWFAWPEPLWETWYIPYDPIFRAPPLWLRVMCWIEVLVFGPLYFVCAFLVRSAKKPSVVVSVFAGAVLYSTVLYFLLELWDPVPHTNALVVLVVNSPWTIVPFALFYQQLMLERRQKHPKRL